MASLGLFCPLTSHVKGYPFEVALPEAIHVQHPRRRELNGGHGLDQGQQHGHQRSIQVPYQRLAGVRKQRTPAFAEGARE